MELLKEKLKIELNELRRNQKNNIFYLYQFKSGFFYIVLLVELYIILLSYALSYLEVA